MMKIKCTYFKQSGKYYSDAEEEFDDADHSLWASCIYPRQFGERLLEMQMLPGLSSGTWDHPFVVEPEGKYPELVIPNP